MGRRDLLDDATVDAAITGLGWERDGALLTKRVRLATFPAAIAFVGRVAEIAEAMNHHPDIDIRWRNVTFTLATHVSGGVTALDVELAGRIDDQASRSA